MKIIRTLNLKKKIPQIVQKCKKLKRKWMQNMSKINRILFKNT